MIFYLIRVIFHFFYKVLQIINDHLWIFLYDFIRWNIDDCNGLFSDFISTIDIIEEFGGKMVMLWRDKNMVINPSNLNHISILILLRWFWWLFCHWYWRKRVRTLCINIWDRLVFFYWDSFLFRLLFLFLLFTCFKSLLLLKFLF